MPTYRVLQEQPTPLGQRDPNNLATWSQFVPTGATFEAVDGVAAQAAVVALQTGGVKYAAESGLLGQLIASDVILCVLSNGQSLSCGTIGHYPCTFPPPSYNIMMPAINGIGGLRMGVYPDFGSPSLITPVDTSTLLGFMPVCPENLTNVGGTIHVNFGETILERACLTLSEYWFGFDGQRVPILAANLGVGTATIANLSKTGAANIPNASKTIYQNQMEIVTKLTALATTIGKRLIILSVLWNQGQSDGATSAYQTLLSTLKGDFNGDVMAITGQTHVPLWVVAPPGALRQTQYYPWRAQLALHNAGTIHIAMPEYPMLGRNGFATDPSLAAPDYVHGNAHYYAIEGEAMMRQVIALLTGPDTRRTMLQPLSVVRTGAQCDVTFDVPVPPIVLDGATAWTDPGNFGVTYSDGSGGGAPTVLSVAVLNAKTLRVILSADPSGRSSPILQFAENGPTGPGFTATTYGRSCIRDSAAEVSTVDGVAAANWCLQSFIAI